jgi:hypothetical protein
LDELAPVGEEENARALCHRRADDLRRHDGLPAAGGDDDQHAVAPALICARASAIAWSW